MRRDLFFLSGLAFIALACLWPVVQLGFIGYDDIDYVYQNHTVQSGLNWDSFVWAFSGFHAGNWHPVTWLSHMLDCELFGLDPQEEHWVNLLLHTANTLLLFIWLRGLTGARWRSFLVAALFAAHPLHVQSVAWISERKDVLSAFFCLGTLVAYTRYCREKRPANYLLVIVLFALGLMAKPMLVTLPIVLLLLDFWPLARVSAGAPAAFNLKSFLSQWRSLLVEKIPLFLLCLAVCIITVYAQKSAGAMHVMETSSLGDRTRHAIVSYSLYLGKMVWPVNLAIFYPMPRSGPGALAVIGSILLLAILTWLGIWWRKSRPYFLIGWLWFLAMLVPVIGVVQVGLQAMADRYAYLPSISLFILAAWGMAEIAAGSGFRRIVMAGAGGVAVLACGLDTSHQLVFWRDNISLFQHAVEISPEDDYLGYFYLGISYAEKGDLENAANGLTLALAAEPDFVAARQRLGNVLLKQEKYAAAEPVLQALTTAQPDDYVARVTHGLALAGQKRYLDAQSEFEAAQRLAPGNPEIDRMLSGNAPKAGAELALINLARQAETNDSPAVHIQIAQAHGFLKQYTAAVEQYRLVLAKTPDSIDSLNNLAWILATCPDAGIRNGAQAVKLAQHACDLTQYKQTMLIGTLAAAYAEAGQFDAAVATAQKACDSATAQGETDLLDHNKELLTLYQTHQAYHEPAEIPETP